MSLEGAGASRASAIYLDGRIRLLDEIGRGAMGSVFSAVDEELQRPVAVKFLLPELQAQPAMVRRFRREARATASINNTNVIRIYTTGRCGSSDYFVAEYLDGHTVEEFLQSHSNREEHVPLPCALWIIDQTCAGLEAVHGASVVHRDLKPGNLMVEAETGRVVIMDFGIGTRAGPSSPGETFESGGTPGYMAPEVIAKGTVATKAEHLADIYALGATAFELLTRRLPFVGETWVEVLQGHLSTPPEAPSLLRPDLPPEVDDVVLTCLSKSPAKRFATAREVRRALSPLLARLRSGSSTRRWRSAPAELREPPASWSLPSSNGPMERTVKTPSRAPATSPRDQAVTILLSHRDPSLAITFREELLRALPKGVLEATRSPSAGLALAKRLRPAMLIAPLHDTDLNGLELAALVQGDRDLRGTRLILIVETVTAAERQLLGKLGVTELLATPVEPRDIVELFGRLLSARTARAAQ